MQLSVKAKTDLRQILEKEIGPKCTEEFQDTDLDNFGMFLLSIFAESLKLKTHSYQPEKSSA